MSAVDGDEVSPGDGRGSSGETGGTLDPGKGLGTAPLLAHPLTAAETRISKTSQTPRIVISSVYRRNSHVA
jgi:hypothetical protein